ncbi:MAG: hypothetical protein LBR77_10540 [Lachnospiraceae bacterium]|nr:hypothetical protein [Lachnospiraceae bacterium]
MSLPKEAYTTLADVDALPEGDRAELVDGHLYMMASPGLSMDFSEISMKP